MIMVTSDLVSGAELALGAAFVGGLMWMLRRSFEAGVTKIVEPIAESAQAAHAMLRDHLIEESAEIRGIAADVKRLDRKFDAVSRANTADHGRIWDAIRDKEQK